MKKFNVEMSFAFTIEAENKNQALVQAINQVPEGMTVGHISAYEQMDESTYAHKNCCGGVSEEAPQSVF